MPSDVRVAIPEDEEKNKKPKDTGMVKSISKHVADFMCNTSIHGLKYLVGDERTVFEKGLWFMVLIVLVYTCSVWIKLTWQKWEENPTVIGFSQSPMRLWKIPFPAVTICPGYEFNKESNFTFSYIVKDKEWKTGNVSTFCDTYDNYNGDCVTEFEHVNFFGGPKWEKYLIETAIRDDQFLFVYNVEKPVAPVLTEYGVCYSYNMLDKKDLLRNITYIPNTFGNQDSVSHWTFDKNYFKTNETVYPRRSKTIQDLHVFNLNPNLHTKACRGLNEYLIILHHPGDVPSTKRAIEIENNKTYDIRIRPNMIVTSDSLKCCPPSRKKCFFSDERHLYFYKIYTVENCKMECLANYTLRRCGCVPYYLPYTNGTLVCARWKKRNMRCIYEAEEVMLESESGISENHPNLPRCNCLPSCNSVTYTADIRVKDSPHITFVIVNFQEAEFMVLERQELFGDVNFWASCGGLVALFTGFTVISLVEMIYYLIFPWIYNFGRRLFQQLYRQKFMISNKSYYL